MWERTEWRQLLVDNLDPLLTESLIGAMKSDIATTPPLPPRPPDVRNWNTPQIYVNVDHQEKHPVPIIIYLPYMFPS